MAQKNKLEIHLENIENKLGSDSKMPLGTVDPLDWHLTKIESLIEGGGSGGDIPEPDEGDEGKVPSVKDDLSGFEYKEKADLVDGKVPSNQLPSYVDDVLEFDDKEHFPVPSERGKIYVALDTGFTYRWSGSEYIQIGGQDLSNFVDLTSAQTITGVKTLPIGTKIKVNDNYYYEFTNDNFGQIGFKRNGQYGVTLDGNTVRGIASLVPQNNNTNDLGISSIKWRDLYLGGALKDGTNSISIADIQPKLTAGTGIAISNNVISSTLEGIDYEVDDQLPATGQKGIIYLIPNGESDSENIYDEYIWIPPETSGSTGRFEFIGTTQTDLSNYVTLSTAQNITGNKTFNKIYIANTTTSLLKDGNNKGEIGQANNSIRFYDNNIRVNSPLLRPQSGNTTDLGTSTATWKDLYIAGKINPNANDYGLTMPSTASLTADKEIATTDYFGFKKIPAPSSITLTDEQYEIIKNGAVINGTFLGLVNPVLYPSSKYGAYDYGTIIGTTGQGETVISAWRYYNLTKQIVSFNNQYAIKIRVYDRGLSINDIPISQYYKKPQSSVSLSDGDTITDSTLKTLIQNEQPIKLNGFTCYFSCDDGTNYQYVSTRYDANANKNHINVITINKTTWVATFHTSDIALS